MFHVAKHRHQIILAVEFDEAGTEVYHEVKGNTEEEILLETASKIDLQSLLKQVGSDEPPPAFLGNLTTASKFVSPFPLFLAQRASTSQVICTYSNRTPLTLSNSPPQ